MHCKAISMGNLTAIISNLLNTNILPPPTSRGISVFYWYKERYEKSLVQIIHFQTHFSAGFPSLMR